MKANTIYKQRYRAKHLNLAQGEKCSSSLNGLGFLALRTQQEVADMLGISRQRVQQAERRAFARIRESLKLTKEDFFESSSSFGEHRFIEPEIVKHDL